VAWHEGVFLGILKTENYVAETKQNSHQDSPRVGFPCRGKGTLPQRCHKPVCVGPLGALSQAQEQTEFRNFTEVRGEK